VRYFIVDERKILGVLKIFLIVFRMLMITPVTARGNKVLDNREIG